MDNYLPGLADGAAGERSRKDGALVYVPSNWGTEALVYNKETAVLGDPPSLGALFDPANQVVLRPRSALTAMGRWLEAQGKLPRPWMDCYTDMAAMTELWDIALAECVKAKGNVVQFWSGENEANAGFVANGATRGPVLGFDRLQPAQRWLWLYGAGRRCLCLASGFRADEERGQRRSGA